MTSAIVCQGIGFGGVHFMPTLGFSAVGATPAASARQVPLPWSVATNDIPWSI